MLFEIIVCIITVLVFTIWYSSYCNKILADKEKKEKEEKLKAIEILSARIKAKIAVDNYDKMKMSHSQINNYFFNSQVYIDIFNVIMSLLYKIIEFTVAYFIICAIEIISYLQLVFNVIYSYDYCVVWNYLLCNKIKYKCDYEKTKSYIYRCCNSALMQISNIRVFSWSFIVQMLIHICRCI